MLALQIHLTDLREHWLVDGRSLRFGESYLAPYLHPAVVPSAFDDGERLALLLVEGSTSDFPLPLSISDCSKADYNSRVDEASRHKGDTLLVEIDRKKSCLEITAGYAGAAPVYLALEGNTLHGNHDFHAIAQLLPEKYLDKEIAAHYLLGSLPYGSRTLLRKRVAPDGARTRSLASTTSWRLSTRPPRLIINRQNFAMARMLWRLIVSCLLA